MLNARITRLDEGVHPLEQVVEVDGRKVKGCHFVCRSLISRPDLEIGVTAHNPIHSLLFCIYDFLSPLLFSLPLAPSSSWIFTVSVSVSLSCLLFLFFSSDPSQTFSLLERYSHVVSMFYYNASLFGRPSTSLCSISYSCGNASPLGQSTIPHSDWGLTL